MSVVRRHRVSRANSSRNFSTFTLLLSQLIEKCPRSLGRGVSVAPRTERSERTPFGCRALVGALCGTSIRIQPWGFSHLVLILQPLALSIRIPESNRSDRSNTQHRISPLAPLSANVGPTRAGRQTRAPEDFLSTTHAPPERARGGMSMDLGWSKEEHCDDALGQVDRVSTPDRRSTSRRIPLGPTDCRVPPRSAPRLHRTRRNVARAALWRRVPSRHCLDTAIVRH